MKVRRLTIPGMFPDIRILCFDLVVVVLFGFGGIQVTVVQGLGTEFVVLGFLMGFIYCIGTCLVGVWDLGDSLLIGYGVYFHRIRKSEVARLTYGWTPVAPFGKQLCLMSMNGRLLVVPGGQLRTHKAEARTVEVLLSILPARVRAPN